MGCTIAGETLNRQTMKINLETWQFFLGLLGGGVSTGLWMMRLWGNHKQREYAAQRDFEFIKQELGEIHGIVQGLASEQLTLRDRLTRLEVRNGG